MSLLFVVKRAVGILIQPLGLVFACGLVALLLYAAKRRRAALWAVVAAWCVLFAASFPPLTRWTAGFLENRHAPFFAEANPGYRPEAVVVLGNGVAHPGDPLMPALARLNATALARLTEGVRLARHYPDTVLIVSGNGLGLENCADAMALAAEELGIQPERIVRLTESMDTADEARLVRRRMGGKRVLLVTTATHMPRAYAYFKNSNVDATPAPCDFIGAVSPSVRARADSRSFRPKGVNLTDSERIWHELLGLLYYRWFVSPGSGEERHE